MRSSSEGVEEDSPSRDECGDARLPINRKVINSLFLVLKLYVRKFICLDVL